jgi:hypothetical protein
MTNWVDYNRIFPTVSVETESLISNCFASSTWLQMRCSCGYITPISASVFACLFHPLCLRVLSSSDYYTLVIEFKPHLDIPDGIILRSLIIFLRTLHQKHAQSGFLGIRMKTFIFEPATCSFCKYMLNYILMIPLLFSFLFWIILLGYTNYTKRLSFWYFHTNF